MKLEYIDIHAHLNLEQFDEDREELIKLLILRSVRVINVGINYNTSFEVVRLAEKYPKQMYAIVGAHPTDAKKENFEEKNYIDLIQHPSVVGIGECGLDYFRMDGDVEKQKKSQEILFRKQIELAIKYDKPLMIHCRDAYSEVLEILNEYKKNVGDKLRGNIHFFVGDTDIARQFLNLNFTISFTGVLTFATQYEEVVKFTPLDMIHAETDSPFVAPLLHRGQRNNPVYITEIVQKVAQIKGVSEIEASLQLLKNSKRVFGI